ncbi:MAG: hypothetical protein HRT61_22375 [Ekhidna sp.]|nr:hypothetical protein [Ekhidna sp.]
MKNTFLLALSLLVLSCGTKGESKSEEGSLADLKDEVMAIHDEVMPKMGDLRKTRMMLESIADSLIVVDSIGAVNLRNLASEIDAANEGMMQWMRAYEPDFQGTEDEVRKYLENQKTLISKVKEDMNGSLAKGKEAIAN